MGAMDRVGLRRFSRSLGPAAALACLVVIASACLAGRAIAEARTALVVGNAKYSSNPLTNPGNDAEAIAKALTSVGFSVTKLIDADAATFQAVKGKAFIIYWSWPNWQRFLHLVR